ncbi:MAG: hypothetical protein ACE5G9_12695 [Nitrospinales bacterium]
MIPDKRREQRRVEISLEWLLENDRRKGERRGRQVMRDFAITPEVEAAITLLEEKGLIARDEVLQRIKEVGEKKK